MKHKMKTVSPATALLIAVLALACGIGMADGKTGRDGGKSLTEGVEKVIKTDEEWKKLLTPEQYQITRQGGTERAFTGEYWNFKGEGTYHCVGCGQALFDSKAKFESGTGWPSFTRPLDPPNVTSRTDHKLLVGRTEVRSKRADSHLGHVFEDGPPPTGLRYCLNSASLRFVPLTKLEEEGYGAYKALFEKAAAKK